MATETFYGLAADGYLQKTGATYVVAQGGTPSVYSGYSFTSIGQWYSSGVGYGINRTYLGFNTATIPDDATIISVILRLTQQSDQSDTNFDINGQAKSWGATLEAGDWSASPVATFSKNSSLMPGVSKTLDFTPPVASVSKTGNTEYEMWSSREGTTPTGNEMVGFYSGNDATYKPQLIVTYSLPPTSPTDLSPGASAVFDATAGKQFTATHNDPDGDAMAAYQIEVYNNTTGVLVTDTGWVTATQFAHTFAAATFANGTTYKWRARTKDSYGVVGAWSDYVVFSCSAVPTCSVTSPTSGETKTTRTFTATHSYSSAGGYAQASYQYVFKQGGITVLDSGVISGIATSYAAVLTNDGDFTVEVTVTDTNAQTSTSSAIAFSVSTVLPNAPTVTTAYNATTASVTASVTNTTYKAHSSVPTYTGTGNGTISQPTVTDGTTATGTWTAEHVTLASVKSLAVMGVVNTITSFECFDIKFEGTHVGYAAIGTAFLYNGCEFTITQGSTPFVDGDKFTWDTFAHTISYNRIYRRVTGETAWTLCKDDLTPASPATWTDYTVASDQNYEYAATSVDVFTNESNKTVAASIAVDFDNYWLVDQANATVFQMQGGDRLGKMQSERGREEYKGIDAVYPSVNYSPERFYRGSFQFVLLKIDGERMPTTVDRLRDIADAETKTALVLKSFSGDVFYCDVYNFSFSPVDRVDWGRDVAFEIVELGEPEDVFPE